MTEILFKLDVFEGPLDLLLKLISRHKLNIYDIEISKLLEQYLAFIDECHEQKLEIAGEFLEMASHLIYIKTVSLLPKPESDEALKLKKELEGTLIEYSICKLTALKLSERFTGNDIFVRKPMKIKSAYNFDRVYMPERLVMTYINMSYHGNPESEHQIIENKINSVVKKKRASVISKVVFILRKLYNSKQVYMDSVYKDVCDRSERVAIFLAILELTKNGRIKISDDNEIIYFAGRKNERKSDGN